MKLIDEQYSQVLKYVDGEMNAAEQQAFEADMAQNRELYDEVVFYQELRLLSESVNQKINTMKGLPGKNKKNADAEIWTMIAAARKDWENHQEADLKVKYGIPSTEINGFQEAQPHSTKKLMIRETESSEERSAVSPSGDEYRNVKKIRSWKWLMAAAVIALFSLVGWWYWQQTNDEAKLANRKEEAASMTVNNNKEINKQANTDQKKTSAPVIEGAPSEARVKPDEHTIAKQDKNKVIANRKNKPYNIAPAKRQALFASHFKPDTAPADRDSRLRNAFAYYDTGDYENALLAFVKSEALVKRGFDEKADLKAFYTNYYKAQSYMAMDSMARAVPLLKAAIAAPPDSFWKSKAEWYLALAYLKIGNVKETESLLKPLTRNNTPEAYKQKATRLTKELSKKI
ncbi:MAG: hypothetical protein ICV53_10990 [Flavisolibacter sp.]|nr:hypothetical protein [Flavisolibacter sp.]